MFELSEDHELFRKVVRDFAETRIAPHVAQWDREHHFPVDVVAEMGQLGLFGLNVPEEYGGAAGDFTSLCVAIEELGRVDQSMGITLEAAVGLGINPLLAFGTTEQKQQWLPDLVAGRALLTRLLDNHTRRPGFEAAHLSGPEREAYETWRDKPARTCNDLLNRIVRLQAGIRARQLNAARQAV